MGLRRRIAAISPGSKLRSKEVFPSVTVALTGTESESWYVDNFVIYRQPHFVKDDVAIMRLLPSVAASFFSVSNFATLSWIGKDTFQRILNWPQQKLGSM